MQLNLTFLSATAKNFLGGNHWQAKLGFLIFLITAVLIGYFVILIVTTPFYVHRMKEGAHEQKARAFQTLPPLQEISAYQESIGRHPLFGASKEKATVPARSSCDEFKSKYQLAGIVGGAENEALFNSKTGKQTHFAKTGEVIEGVAIEAVERHRVTLNCSGQKVDMEIEET